MIVDVAVPFRVGQSFHYSVAPELEAQLALGSVIQVPFKNRTTHAFVLGFPETSSIAQSRMRSIELVLTPEPIFDEPMLKFLRWVSEYYCHPLGEVIATAVPKSYWKVKKRKKEGEPTKSPAIPNSNVFDASKKPDLNEEQGVALQQILSNPEKRPILLHGVTGSGKTEVYMCAIEHALQAEKGAIVLVPEIALTPQLLGRFSSRFPGKVAVLHSDLTERERFSEWQRLRQGQARIAVGARSAVFAPVKNLGLIVVDEEHETSYKQEDSVRYHGRDVAIVRASLERATVILGSATPCLETFANAQSGKYLYLQLKNRVQQRPMPKTTFVDLKDKTQLYSEKIPWLSRFLISRIEHTLRSRQQTMLYLNRLGFAHFLFCHDCGETLRCKNCDVALTYYTLPPSLKCHYCGTIKKPPSQCDHCSGIQLESIGVGTEQVEKALVQLFPQAKIARMDRSVIKTRKDLESMLSRIAKQDVDIVIGTQMIAKGHDFPGIALVGILLADASLNLPDFRAYERTYQVITQVSGRAGRADTPGEVVIQSLNPDHPVLQAAAQYRPDEFFRTELEGRRQFGFPPFQRLAMIRFQHANAKKVETFACQVADYMRSQIQKSPQIGSLIGPSTAPLSRLKNLYRWQCLLKSTTVKGLQNMLKALQTYCTAQKSSVGMSIDVDPISSL